MIPFLLIFALFFVDGPVAIYVRPQYAMSPAGFQATVFIERDPDNRLLKIEYDGPEYKASYHQLDGAQRQRIFQPRVWELRTAGQYVARATLIRVTNGRSKTLVSTKDFRVLGHDEAPSIEW